MIEVRFDLGSSSKLEKEIEKTKEDSKNLENSVENFENIRLLTS